ncbi:unnamed protein product [Phytophthora lilii]|uniref:Unnamed protein product n=1 Tax=Phytophthora lilii TaxID=2077276 RepID=A0A9W7CMS3_9STRA|nr:unnamed protein product [Phytophthora lilii]
MIASFCTYARMLCLWPPGDLKPANFLFVNGALKLIDFGIAKAISNDTTNIVRDSQIGTVNYMSPEAIQGNTQPNGQRDPQGKMKVRLESSSLQEVCCLLTSLCAQFMTGWLCKRYLVARVYSVPDCVFETSVRRRTQYH